MAMSIRNREAINRLAQLNSELIRDLETGHFYSLSLIHRTRRVGEIKRMLNSLVREGSAGPGAVAALLTAGLLISGNACTLSELNLGHANLREFTNHPPEADAGGDITQSPAEFSFDGSASSDPDGDSLDYSWTFTGRNSSAEYQADSAAGSIALNEEDIFDAVLTVTDEHGAMSRDSAVFTHQIIAANQSPVADAGADQSQTDDQYFTYDGSGSSDPDGDTLIYSWTFVGRNSAASHSAVGVTGIVALPEEDIFDVTLTVQDPDGLTATDTAVFAHSINLPPVADPGPDQNQQNDNVFTFDGSASSDPEGGGLTYSWTFTGRNYAQVYNESGVSGSVSFNEFDIFDVELTVTDDRGLTDSAAAVFTYGNDSAPAFAAPEETTNVRDTGIAFGLNPYETYYEYSFALADIDGDGDLDAVFRQLTTSVTPEIFVQYNSGGAASPVFEPRTGTNPINMPSDLYYTVTDFSFISVDPDGDLDLIQINEQYGSFYTEIVENEGSVNSMDFTNDVTLTASLQYSTYARRFAAADLDFDGDFDLVYANSEGSLTLSRNNGSTTAPDFSYYAPYGLVDSRPLPINTGSNPRIAATDFDRDGDIDVFTLSQEGDFYFIENIGDRQRLDFDQATINPFGLAQLTSPVIQLDAADIDADGDVDLFVAVYGSVYGPSTTQVYFFENTEF